MSIMKRDVNLGLLLLIVATLIMFSGFTVYYKTTFQNISQSYESKLKELQQVSEELKSKRSQLNETSIQLKLRQEREENLDVKYNEVRNEREALQVTKTTLEGELSNTKGLLASKISELSSVKNTLAVRETELAEKTIKLNNAISDIASLKKDKNSLQAKVDCLKSKADAEESSC